MSDSGQLMQELLCRSGVLHPSSIRPNPSSDTTCGGLIDDDRIAA